MIRDFSTSKEVSKVNDFYDFKTYGKLKKSLEESTTVSEFQFVLSIIVSILFTNPLLHT